MEIILIAVTIACSLGLGGASFQISRRSKPGDSEPRRRSRASQSQDSLFLPEGEDAFLVGSRTVSGILRKLRKWIAPADRAPSQDHLSSYSHGVSEFQRLLEDQTHYFGNLVSSKERIILTTCQSAEDDLCSARLLTRKKQLVQYPVELKDSSIFNIACTCLSLNRPFVVQGFNGRKIDDLDVVQGEAWRYFNLSTIINSPLGLSSTCKCGISRPPEPTVDPEKDMIAAIVFRLAWSVSKFLTCPCGNDDRVSEEENSDMYCRAVYNICQRLEDIFASMSGNEEHESLSASCAGICIRYNRWDRRLNLSGRNPSSFARAMGMVSRIYNSFLLAVYSEDLEDETLAQSMETKVTSEEAIETICARLTEAHDADVCLDWLCFNKWNVDGVQSVPTHKLPVHTEIKRAVRFMDGAGVRYLGGVCIEELKPVRIPFGKERLEWVSFSEATSSGVPMMRKPQFCTSHNVFCVGRPRLRDLPASYSNEMMFNENGQDIKIAISKEGALLSFKKSTRNVKKVLKGAVVLTMMDNGLGFNLRKVLGKDLYKDDYVFVNEALSLKYGKEVFDFVFSNIMSGVIAVQENSPVASYVPKTSKGPKGVTLTIPLRGDFWKDKHFLLTEQNLYWLPKEGFNYFKVERRTGDGLLTMVEAENLDGQALFKCSAILDTPVG
ncbi:hypothetical protein FGB62_5g545 [Gracilaria domingensis]|nr:hypothetical protein FGB62_5g545 [Gracilaria domingensis]